MGVRDGPKFPGFFPPVLSVCILSSSCRVGEPSDSSQAVVVPVELARSSHHDARRNIPRRKKLWARCARSRPGPAISWLMPKLASPPGLSQHHPHPDSPGSILSRVIFVGRGAPNSHCVSVFLMSRRTIEGPGHDVLPVAVPSKLSFAPQAFRTLTQYLH